MGLRPNPSSDRPGNAYDAGMAPLERLGLRSLRQVLVAHGAAPAGSRILEIGIGTGANLPFYPPDECLAAIDESSDMLLSSAARGRRLHRHLYLSQASAEHLPFSDGTFDTVIGSLVLCSIRDVPQALREIRRVLRMPRGRLLLLEHTRPDSPLLGRLVDLANVPWLALNGRCHLNRQTSRTLVEAGFNLEWVEKRAGGLVRLIAARVPPADS